MDCVPDISPLTIAHSYVERCDGGFRTRGIPPTHGVVSPAAVRPGLEPRISQHIYAETPGHDAETNCLGVVTDRDDTILNDPTLRLDSAGSLRH